MDDLKRFRDFRRWESQLADESYVKSVEEENRELQRTAELLPSLFDKRIEEMRRWMDARLREIQGSYTNKFECALARQNVENRGVHDKIVALAARVDTVQQQQIDSKDTTEQLSTELRAAVEEKFQFARKDVENKLSALSALLEERTDCLKEQEVRTQKHLLQVETDMTQTVKNAEETTQKMICLQDSINDVSGGMDALKADIATRVQKSIDDVVLHTEALKGNMVELRDNTMLAMSADTQRLQQSVDELALSMGGLKEECKTIIAHDMDVLAKELESKRVQEVEKHAQTRADIRALKNDCANTQVICENFSTNVMSVQNSLQDVTHQMDALKDECRSDLALESQKSAAERASICERLLIESDKRAEDGVRIAMRVEEMKKYFAQKEEVWAVDMRMVQETMYFKLQKLDEDLTAATFDLGKQVEGVTNSSQEGLASLDEKLASLDKKITTVATTSEETATKVEGVTNSSQECLASLNEKLASLDKKMTTVATTSEETATKVEGVTNSTKEGLASLDERIVSLDKKITTVATTSEEAATKLQEQSAELCLLRRRKEGNMSFSWNITTNDMEKHEVRSPVFALREVENLVLRLYPKGRLTSKPNFSAISLVRKRERTNPFECEEEPLRVTFTTGSVTSKVRELDAWDDEFDAAVAENFVPTVDLCSTIVVTVV